MRQITDCYQYVSPIMLLDSNSLFEVSK